MIENKIECINITPIAETYNQSAINRVPIKAHGLIIQGNKAYTELFGVACPDGVLRFYITLIVLEDGIQWFTMLHCSNFYSVSLNYFEAVLEEWSIEV